MLFSKSRPSNPSGTGKPKKKDMIATGKLLLPYFDISNDPYFIKKSINHHSYRQPPPKIISGAIVKIIKGI